MSKILLTSGSSFSYSDGWPSILADKLKYNLVNEALPGASNMYIYDKLMYNITNRDPDSIGLVVAGWSYAFKTTLFGERELNFINVEDQDEVSLIEPVIELKANLDVAKCIEQSLRLMIYLQDYCDSKGIKCIHYPLLNLFKSGLNKTEHITVLEKITNTECYHKLSKLNNIIGWPSDKMLGGYSYSVAYPDMFVSKTNHHPSHQGHELIAQEIYDKYQYIEGVSND